MSVKYFRLDKDSFMEHQLGLAIAVTMFLKQDEYHSKFILFDLIQDRVSFRTLYQSNTDQSVELTLFFRRHGKVIDPNFTRFRMLFNSRATTRPC